MRVGDNPMRQKRVLAGYKRHRVIMPVYIPEGSGYYTDALRIFKISLASLLATVDTGVVSITIINNASVPEVDQVIAPLHRDGKIDRYVSHAENRGKPDPVAGELRAAYEEFVTLTDADVLFEPGWLQAVEGVYSAFPEAGCVSPFPSPNLRFHHGTANWLGTVWSARHRLEPLVNPVDLDMFEASLGGAKVYSPKDRALQYAVERNGVTALLGAGHFVCTLRRSLFEDFTYRPQLGGISAGERLIDEHVDRRGHARLSTVSAYVRHMGNTYEAWMEERLAAGGSQAPLSDQLSATASRRPMAQLPFAMRKLLALPLYWLAERRLNRRLRLQADSSLRAT